jgi:hypothetical protein
MRLSRLALFASLLLALTGCAALAQLGGLEVCVAAGRSASVASATPSAAATVIVLAMPSAAPSVAPSASAGPR